MEQNEQKQESVGAPHISVQLPPEPERKKGLAIAALVFGILSIFGLCCCGINIITAPIAIILGIISLAKKRDGTGLAVTGIITASLSLIMILAVIFSFRDIYPYSDTIVRDYTQLIEEQDEVFPQYEEDGTLPDYLLKYTESPFTEFFQKYDITIYDVMDVLLEEYKSGSLKTVGYTLPQETTAPAESSEASSLAAEPV